MQDSKHRNYDYFPRVSKKEQNATDLLTEIMLFVKNTPVNHEDWIILNRLIRNIEKEKHSNKALRGIENKFRKIQQSYQK